MASRKEERERLRVEREQREVESKRNERKRLILGYLVAGVISLAVLAGIVVVVIGGDDGSGDGLDDSEAAAAGIDHRSGTTDDKEVDTREGTEPPAAETTDLTLAAQKAGCQLREELRDEGNTHIDPDSKPPNYKTQPPSSGDHAPNPQADGAYAEPLSPLHFVHSLEHGRVAIAYSPDLPEDVQLELKGLFDSDPEGMMLFPYEDMPYDVAAVAWTQHMGCGTYDDEATLDALRAFRDKWRGRGPEAIPL